MAGVLVARLPGKLPIGFNGHLAIELLPMAKFQYRLQKVYELRERKKRQQEEAVARAMARVREIQAMIEAKKNEIRLLQENMLHSHHMLLGAHDDFIHSQFQELDELYSDLQQAKEQLAWEKQLLIKAHAELEALIKHKEKTLEEWREEEKKLELKVLDEVAGQRYFRSEQEKSQEELVLNETLSEEELALLNSGLHDTSSDIETSKMNQA